MLRCVHPCQLRAIGRGATRALSRRAKEAGDLTRRSRIRGASYVRISEARASLVALYSSKRTRRTKKTANKYDPRRRSKQPLSVNRAFKPIPIDHRSVAPAPERDHWRRFAFNYTVDHATDSMRAHGQEIGAWPSGPASARVAGSSVVLRAAAAVIFMFLLSAVLAKIGARLLPKAARSIPLFAAAYRLRSGCAAAIRSSRARAGRLPIFATRLSLGIRAASRRNR
jgi:hypothetical protein